MSFRTTIQVLRSATTLSDQMSWRGLRRGRTKRGKENMISAVQDQLDARGRECRGDGRERQRQTCRQGDLKARGRQGG
eukprot:768201-Hanusia_phi.AAC.1